jgi:phosphoglycerol transferase MdoB-like AlkP superfamily enzyme
VLRSGAFSDGKVYYIPSADGLFKNGTCYDAATGEKQNVSLCQAKADQAKKQLEISDKTITYDLIRKFRETP